MIRGVQVVELHSDAQFEISESGVSTEVLVVLIHGSLDRSSGMARVARHVSQFSKVVRYDRRGYGHRWSHKGPFTVDENVDDVIALLNGRDAIVVGHSYGGQIALACASKLGAQIRAVSVYETPLSWLSWWPTNTAGATGITAGPENAAEAFMIRMIGQDRWDVLPEKTKNERRREGRALVDELSALRQGPSWSAESIQCPVIVGCGTLGGEHHKKGADWLCEQIASSTKVVIEGANHGAHLSHAAEFTELLIRPHCEGVGTLTEMS